jgi:hypothetical protein
VEHVGIRKRRGHELLQQRRAQAQRFEILRRRNGKSRFELGTDAGRIVLRPLAQPTPMQRCGLGLHHQITEAEAGVRIGQLDIDHANLQPSKHQDAGFERRLVLRGYVRPPSPASDSDTKASRRRLE